MTLAVAHYVALFALSCMQYEVDEPERPVVQVREHPAAVHIEWDLVVSGIPYHLVLIRPDSDKCEVKKLCGLADQGEAFLRSTLDIEAVPGLPLVLRHVYRYQVAKIRRKYKKATSAFDYEDPPCGEEANQGADEVLLLPGQKGGEGGH